MLTLPDTTPSPAHSPHPGLPLPLPLLAPVFLCSALSRSLVMSGCSDGEVRLWHCEDLHSLAFRLAFADLLGRWGVLEGAGPGAGRWGVLEGAGPGAGR